MPIKIDLHIHTVYSGDSLIEPEMAVEFAKKAGLDGIAITDHNNLEVHGKIRSGCGLTVIPGVEVTSLEGHILALGVKTHIEAGLTAQETVDRIRTIGGVAVVPHPMSFFRNGLSESVIRKVKPDAIETLNSSTPFTLASRRGVKLSRTLKLPQTGGSDAHTLGAIGRAYTLIEAEDAEVESILAAIKKGKINPAGRRLSTWEQVCKMVFRVKRKMGIYSSSI